VLFVFLVLSNERRQVIHFNATDSPTAFWSGQQIVEAFPWDTAPKYLLRDRDGIYGNDFVRRVSSMGIEKMLISARSPWQSPYGERVTGSIRRECLDHVIVLNELHLGRILTSYFRYYHAVRTHLGLDKDCPVPRPVDLQISDPFPRSRWSVVCTIGTSVGPPKEELTSHRYAIMGPLYPAVDRIPSDPAFPPL
jgi:hypothetical protein